MIRFGANVGINLKALQLLYPAQQQCGIEINEQAAQQLGEVIPPERVIRGSTFDFKPQRVWDVMWIKSVLTHVKPAKPPQVCEALYRSTGQHLLVAEYYNPTPVEVSYRGHLQRLFKLDFAGDLMAAFLDLCLVDYSLVYRHDPVMPQDDITWFLMRKLGVPA